MSADGYNVCPACYARASGVPFAEITQLGHLNNADDLGVDEEGLYEYFENYLDNAHVVFEYHGGDCRECGYRIPAFTLRHPIPAPPTPPGEEGDEHFG